MIDVTRHESIFHPVEWGARRVDVIGAGATGSKVALSLAKLGVKNLHAWDGDVVEEHNLANQVYVVTDVGHRKTDRLLLHVEDVRQEGIAAHGWWDGEPVGEVVMMMADSMKVRRQLFEAVKWNPNVKLVIDSRMGADTAFLYTYRPGNRQSLKSYEGTLFSDDDAHVEVSACGTSISVGPTSDIISGLATWMFIRHAAGEEVEPALGLGARQPSIVIME